MKCTRPTNKCESSQKKNYFSLMMCHARQRFINDFQQAFKSFFQY